MAVLMSLLAAFAAGTSDFLGGMGSRKAPAVLITAASQVTGFVVAIALALAIDGNPTTADLVWGGVGGVGAATGLLSIYAGYANASVTITAPVAGVGTAAVPIIYDVVTGDDLSTLSLVGIVLGLVAIGLVSLQRSETAASATTSLLYGLGGAAGLGFLLVCLGQTSDDGGVWPVASTRLVAFIFMAVVVVATRTPVALPRTTLPFVLGIGILGSAANALFVSAAQIGSISTAAVLVSMFPAVTVLWARVVLKERLRPIQIIGLATALVAVGLIAGG